MSVVVLKMLIAVVGCSVIRGTGGIHHYHGSKKCAKKLLPNFLPCTGDEYHSPLHVSLLASLAVVEGCAVWAKRCVEEVQFDEGLFANVAVYGTEELAGTTARTLTGSSTR
jgi:hypothetical protein